MAITAAQILEKIEQFYPDKDVAKRVSENLIKFTRWGEFDPTLIVRRNKGPNRPDEVTIYFMTPGWSMVEGKVTAGHLLATLAPPSSLKIHSEWAEKWAKEKGEEKSDYPPLLYEDKVLETFVLA